ncbi:MAG: DUF6629 family protein [Minisyncoccota bacterium]
MCFSATASFVAGGALSAVGVATIARAKTARELPLASIPLLFGIQQIIDGVVWVSFGIPSLNTIAVYAYALLAFAWWPMLAPYALLSIETTKTRREILEALSLVGLGVGLFFLYFILSGTVTARIINNCVAYDTPHPYQIGILAFYLIAISGPFFVSRSRILRLFGVVLIVSFAIAGWFYVEIFSSVWCFFAAILSAILFWYFKNRPRR